MNSLNDVIADLQWCIEYWPDLIEARIPGTRRPWRQPHLSPDAQAKRDFEARIDWAMRVEDALGETPAPVDVAILSTVLDLLVQADDLAAKVAPEVMCPVLPPPGPGELDARPYLRFIAGNLPEILADWAEPIARNMQQKIAQALCMVYDGQTLAVTCPWCSTPDAWRVQELPGGMVAIICTGVCEPPEREVGTWWGGQPCWPIQDWPRLAKHVQAAEKKQKRKAS